MNYYTNQTTTMKYQATSTKECKNCGNCTGNNCNHTEITEKRKESEIYLGQAAKRVKTVEEIFEAIMKKSAEIFLSQKKQVSVQNSQAKM